MITIILVILVLSIMWYSIAKIIVPKYERELHDLMEHTEHTEIPKK